jgi:acyl carrier protein
MSVDCNSLDHAMLPAHTKPNCQAAHRETALNFVNPLTSTALAQSPFEQEMAAVIVDSLQLEIDAARIVPQDPLFIEGLGLDSIDALELALAISRRYGVELRSDDARNGEIFASLRSLSAHVDMCRTR